MSKFRTGCLYFLAAYFLFGLSIVLNWIWHWNEVSPRAGIAMMNTEFRLIAVQLQNYYKEHHSYPPAEVDGEIYTFTSDLLTTPMPIMETVQVRSESSTGYVTYKGPPIDPYRVKPTFDGDVKQRAWFCDGRNSEYFCWYKGYPMRYYRSSNKQYVILLGNGPDKDADLTPAILDKLTTSSWDALQHIVLLHWYDPTNGSVSDGDVWRVVTPE